MGKLKTLPTLAFKTPEKFESWLQKNHETSEGIWLQIFKKDSGKKTVTYPEALDVALCYGWIDGQKQAKDEHSWLQKFGPRGAKSIWSKINTGHVARLIKEGRMQPAGLRAVENAKANGNWERAYDSPSNQVLPDDFLKELSKNKKAATTFKTLNKANLFAIGFRLQTAKKPETRIKRINDIIQMLAKGETFH